MQRGEAGLLQRCGVGSTVNTHDLPVAQAHLDPVIAPGDRVGIELSQITPRAVRQPRILRQVYEIARIAARRAGRVVVVGVDRILVLRADKQ